MVRALLVRLRKEFATEIRLAAILVVVSRYGISLFALALVASFLLFMTSAEKHEDVQEVPSLRIGDEQGLQEMSAASDGGHAQKGELLERSLIPMEMEPEPQNLLRPDTFQVQARLADGSPCPGAFIYATTEEDWILDTRARNMAHQDSDPFHQASVVGEKFLCDAEGNAFLPRKYLGGSMAGEYGSLVANAWSPDDDLVELQFHEDALIQVQVKAEDGTPVEGVDVAGVELWDGGEDGWVVISSRTNELGEVRLRDLWEFFDQSEENGLVEVLGVFRSPVEERFELGSLPEQPFQLVVPRYGSATVRMDDEFILGDSKKHRVELLLDPNPSEGRSLAELKRDFSQSQEREIYRYLIQGEATFACLGLGLPLLAHVVGVDPLDSTYLSFMGPQSEGEHLVVTAKPLLADKRFILDAVDSKGNPVPKQRFTVQILVHQSGQWNVRSLYLDSDEDGRLDITEAGRMLMDTPFDSSVKVLASYVSSVDGAERSGQVSIRLERVLESESLGTVYLKQQEPLVSGKVLGVTPQEMASYPMWIEHMVGKDRRGIPKWEIYAYALLDESGFFFCPYGENPPSGDLRIHPPWRHNPLGVVPFAAGARGLIIELGQAHQLVGEIVMPTKQGKLYCTFEPHFFLPGVKRSWKFSIGPSGKLKLKNLGRQSGRLVIRGMMGAPPLFELKDAQPTPRGQPGDPRLNPIPLGETMVSMSVILQNAGGQSEVRALMRYPDSEKGWHGVNSQKPTYLFAGTSTLDVEIHARGFLAQTATLGAGENIILMHPGADIHLLFQGMERMPPEAKMEVLLRPLRTNAEIFETLKYPVPPSGRVSVALSSSDAYICVLEISYQGRTYIRKIYAEEDHGFYFSLGDTATTTIVLPMDAILKCFEY